MAWVRAVRVTGVVAGLVFVAGCGGSDAGAKAPVVKNPEVAATEACSGLLGEAGGDALGKVLQSWYLVPDAKGAVGAVAMAKAVEEARAVPSCVVTGRIGSGKRVAEVRPAVDGAAGGGVRVVRADKERAVAFDCVSARAGAAGSVRLSVAFKDQWDSEGEAKLAGDYLVIAHSAARALAKELGCRDGGGLPEQASALPAG